MRKRVYIVVAALLIAGIGVAMWASTHERDPGPAYRGKTLGYWLRSMVNAKTVMEANAIQGSDLDSNSIPVLVRFMEKPAGPLGRCYGRAWWKLPRWLQERLPRPVNGTRVRLRAMFLLGQMREKPKPAVPALLRILTGDRELDLRVNAPLVLVRFVKEDPAVMAAMVEALHDKEPLVRNSAAWVLRELVNDHTAVVVEALNNSDVCVRNHAMVALLNSKLSRPEVAAAVRKCLADPDGGIRRSATNLFTSSGLFRYITNAPGP